MNDIRVHLCPLVTPDYIASRRYRFVQLAFELLA